MASIGTGDAVGALPVMIVGAGPTGLALAAQLHSFGISFRVIDRLEDRGRESRALAVQARTLEVLQSLGLGEQLVAAGRTSTRLVLHLEGRLAEARLGGFGAADTRFPFILFVSQAETEAILESHLEAGGVPIERGVELVDFAEADGAVACTLRHPDGRQEQVDAAFLVGCDGAHSTVRKRSAIPFEGAPYLQDFMLGDVEAEGPIVSDAINPFAGSGGVAIFFPLGSPSTWRVVAMAPGSAGETSTSDAGVGDLSLGELQAVVDGATGSAIRLRDPVWLTHFRLHHRQAARYRAGRVFLAGDAGHIHSPVGAQGMNTGIQDAWNLGWKLAFVAREWAGEALLDSYESERWPVGRALLRTTDRVFGVFVRALSSGPVAAFVRREVVARVLPRILRSARLRDLAFDVLSELRIHYRGSPAVTEGKPALRAGPKAGSRLPDAPLMRGGEQTFLQEEVAGPALHLLLCGDPERWSGEQLSVLESRYGIFLTRHTLVRGARSAGGLSDPTGEAFGRLGVEEFAQYLVRPDGYIGYRCAGHDLRGVTEYLAARYNRPPGAASRPGAPTAV